ncbi:MAG: twin-arginine translocase TatA/TatE family subunit [Flavobacteriaceae bacterium]|jgi:sec-independent protein translocase protein tatA/E homolog|nr:twin-arginine translocase TatA/TatE family subunit [Flavobacteriaceae bacterium]MBB1561601.1 twin-arginine translocase TatA/TatE family subunit [Flavobacteriaceae bacterium]MBB1573993.1 twin-arginine translocase TatA/TatE family subunit [Flavobacteriaceae bacterium]RKW60777.1 MAG: twin-arginine translocase TatA/TatE family subunit [Riemerella sp.]
MNSILTPLFMGLGMREILVIAILILLLFGAKRIPEFMKGLGSGIKEFKKSMKEDDKENDNTEDKTTK